MKKWQIALVVAVVVAVAAGGYFGGRATAGGGTPTVEEAMQVLQNQVQNGAAGGSGFPGGSGANDPTGMARGGGAVFGSIIAADASSITVKTADGSSKIVLLSSGTTVNRVSDGALADLKTDENVIVTGTENSDGTVTATRIQVGGTLAISGTGGPGSGSTSPAPGNGSTN